MSFFVRIVQYLPVLVPLISLLGCFLGVCYFKKLHFRYRMLVFLLFYSLMNEGFSYFSALFWGSNLVFLTLYSSVELILIYLFLREDITQKKKTDILFSGIMLFNLYEIFSTDYQNFNMFQTYSRTLNSFFLLALLIFVIFKQLNKDQFDVSNKLYFALPFYLTINAILFTPLNLLINYNDIGVFIVWTINILNVIVFFSFLIYQIWKLGKTQII